MELLGAESELAPSALAEDSRHAYFMQEALSMVRDAFPMRIHPQR